MRGKIIKLGKLLEAVLDVYDVASTGKGIPKKLIHKLKYRLKRFGIKIK